MIACKGSCLCNGCEVVWVVYQIKLLTSKIMWNHGNVCFYAKTIWFSRKILSNHRAVCSCYKASQFSPKIMWNQSNVCFSVKTIWFGRKILSNYSTVCSCNKAHMFSPKIMWNQISCVKLECKAMFHRKILSNHSLLWNIDRKFGENYIKQIALISHNFCLKYISGSLQFHRKLFFSHKKPTLLWFYMILLCSKNKQVP